MTSKVFTSGTVIDSAWLNDVNSATYSGGALYTPAGTGAIPTTTQNKLREGVSVLDFGADPTGATSSSAAFQAAIDYVYANLQNTGYLYSLALVISQPSWGSAIAKIVVPPGTYKLSTTIQVKSDINLVGENAILYMMGGGINTSNFNVTIDGFYMVTDGTTATAIYMTDMVLGTNIDTPICTIKNVFFRNFSKCFGMDPLLSSGYTMISFEKCHTENCDRFISEVYSDSARVLDCSFRSAFTTAGIPFISNYGGMTVERCVFVPWPEVTNPTPITNAHWFANYGRLSIQNCKIGNEDLNAGNNNVSPYYSAKNVTLIYNYAEFVSFANNGAVYYEQAAKTAIIVKNNFLFHRNSGAVKFIRVPSYTCIKDNYGATGTQFDANYQVGANYDAVLDFTGCLSPYTRGARPFFAFDIDSTNPFNYTGSVFTEGASKLIGWPWGEGQHINGGKTRVFWPDTIVGSMARFYLDVNTFTVSHTGTLTVFGRPRVGAASGQAILKQAVQVQVTYDPVTLVTTKTVSFVGAASIASAAETGTGVVYSTPVISNLGWTVSGAAGTTDVTAITYIITVTYMGVDNALETSYCIYTED